MLPPPGWPVAGASGAETVTGAGGGARGYNVITEQPIQIVLELDGQTLAGVTKTVLIEDIHDNGGSWLSTMLDEEGRILDLGRRIEQLEGASE